MMSQQPVRRGPSFLIGRAMSALRLKQLWNEQCSFYFLQCLVRLLADRFR